MNRCKLILIMITMWSGSLHAIDFPELKGWKPISEVVAYHPDNLYEYIDGAADQFIAYGFQELLSRDLSSESLQVTIDIYDMGTRLNAFGMYKTERPRGERVLAIGSEAYISPPYQCLLFKDNFYVKINAFKGEISDENGRPLLEKIALALPGKIGYPEELDLLPTIGKIPDSEGFVKQAFLGITELNNCVYASYGDGEKEFKYFVIIPMAQETRLSIYQELAKKWKTLEHDKFSILIKTIPYIGLNGCTLLENRIVGVTHCASESELLKRLEAVISMVNNKKM